MVKVTVDYANGCYNVTGLYQGEVFSIHKPIRGVDRDGLYKSNYSIGLLQRRRNQILRDIRKYILNQYPNFNYSSKTIKNADPVMYKALKDWDNMNSTHYAIDYIRTVIQSFDYSNIKPNLFKEKCKKTRAMNLKKAGIDITYSVGMLKTSGNMNIIDKIKGMFIAKKQNNVLGVNVINSFIMNKKSFLEDKNWFKKNNGETISKLDDVKKEAEFYREVKDAISGLKTLPLGQEKFGETTLSEERIKNMVPLEQYDEEFDEFVERMKSNIESKQPVVAIEEQEEIAKPAIQVAEQEEKIENPAVQTIEQEEVMEKPVVQAIEQEEIEKTAVQAIEQEEKIENSTVQAIEIEQEEESIADIIKEEVIAKSKAQVYKQGPTKKAERKNHERVSFYEAQMKRNEQHSAEKAKIKDAHIERIKKEEANAEEVKRLLEIKRAEKENAAKMKELEEARAARIAKLIERADRIQAEKDAKARAEETIQKETAKNKKVLQLNNSELSKKVKDGVKHWTRKINDVKDSIRNKEFKPSPRFKKIIVTGAITLFAASSLSIGMNSFGAMLSNEHDILNKTDVAYSTSNQEKSAELDYATIEIQKEKAPETEKVQEANKAVETVKVKEEQKAPETVKVKEEQKTPETVKVEEEQKTPETEKIQEANKAPEAQETTKTNVQTPNVEVSKQSEKDYIEKLEKFKEYATEKYLKSIVIGETPNVGNLLENQAYSEKPDGTGNIGHINKNMNYHVSHVNIITDTSWDVVDTEGKNLQEILDEYEKEGKNILSWNFHIATSANDLGFITNTEYNKLVNGKINSIISEKGINNMESETER